MNEVNQTFEALGLEANILKALKQLGYEIPSPIQQQSIPPLMEGRDILGQAQTGTGKTAAFALPILQQINRRQKATQVLVLAPTRELAIQVAEAFQSYARHLAGVHILPIYGGQDYSGQIRALKRGAHIVVGTPGRVMDHMRKGTLNLDGLKHLVLDEADEMLRMGFIDDVEWVLERTPSDRQIALFSATMPKEIAKVANTYLNEPIHVKIKVKTTTAETIRQRYWLVSGLHKLDALTRILEVESFDAMIVFVRTKTTTVELAEKLEARGFSSVALNGDITQKLRERTIERLKKGQVDILVATDVAARGLDVDRISHVINYDIPYDTEGYVHRIGRTGRAGRSGDAILFVAQREMRMLRSIEKATGKKIEVMGLPSVADINAKRLARFREKIMETLAEGQLELASQLVLEAQQESGMPLESIAAALAKLYLGDNPLLVQKPIEKRHSEKGNSEKGNREKGSKRERKEREPRPRKGYDLDQDMETYRIEVGRADGAAPGNIVGAIANEAGIDSRYIGRIKLYDSHSTVDLPADMPKSALKTLKKAWVCQKPLNISRLHDEVNSSEKAGKRADFKKNKKRKSNKSNSKKGKES